jgi:hypothetical protein
VLVTNLDSQVLADNTSLMCDAAAEHDQLTAQCADVLDKKRPGSSRTKCPCLTGQSSHSWPTSLCHHPTPGLATRKAAVKAVSNLVRGYSTKDSVRKIYGDPMNVSFTDRGNELWGYEFSDIQATPESNIPFLNLFSSDVEGRKELVVFFDRSGLVQNYTIT